MSITIFRNKILANLTDLYSPEHFLETLETAAITHEIARLSNPNSIWETSNIKREMVAGNIVSNGLFAFLRGGFFSINQVWVFVCCCFVTFQFIVQFILPSLLAKRLGNLNIGEILFNLARTMRRTKENRDNSISPRRENTTPLPLTDRWPSKNRLDSQRHAKIVKNKDIIEAVALEKHVCDKNMRIVAEINGFKILCLLDTGAHVSLISKRKAKLCGIKSLYQPDFGGVFGIGNNLIPLIAQADIKLKLANCK